MTVKIQVRPPALREDQIRSSIKASQEQEDFYDFRHEPRKLPRIEIAQEFLLYRTENFRTFTAQQEHLAKNNLPHDYFLTGQENESVQQIQHEILAMLARQGRADSIVPIIDVLKAEKQHESLVITRRGIVVNGNRRLAAMRELLAENELLNHEFKFVKCIVLPEDASLEDIIEVEARLQGRPETKLDYDWIGDGQLIKRLFEIGWSDREVSVRLGRKPSEIRRTLAALTEANLYLRDWRRSEGQYRLVSDSEQFFKDMPKLLQGKEAELANASRVVAWTLHDNVDQLDDRVYAFNAVVGKQTANVLDRLSSQLGIALTSESDVRDDGNFLVEIEDSNGGPSYQPVINLLSNEDMRAEAVEALIDISRIVVEEEKGRSKGTVALKELRLVNSRLREVDLGRANPTSYQDLELQLEQIAVRVSELSEELKALQATKGAHNASESE